MKKILMATDLSARSDRALQRALQLASQHAANLEIIHVVDDSLPDEIALLQQETAQRAIEDQVASASLVKTVSPTTRVVYGEGYSDILQQANNFGAELIILGIHRHTLIELFRGTTVERLVRFGNTPVLVVTNPVTGPYRRILAPVDLSTHSRAAVALAANLAPRGEIHLIHATHEPFKGFLGRDSRREIVRSEQSEFSNLLERDLAHLASELGDAAPHFELAMKVGGVHKVVRDQVDHLKPDLIAIGTHGRTGVAHAILGSVAEDLLADAPVDILAVKAL